MGNGIRGWRLGVVCSLGWLIDLIVGATEERERVDGDGDALMAFF